jgi:prefoldin subunit 5
MEMPRGLLDLWSGEDTAFLPDFASLEDGMGDENRRIQGLDNRLHSLGGTVESLDSSVAGIQRSIGALEGSMETLKTPSKRYERVSAGAAVASALAALLGIGVTIGIGIHQSNQAKQSAKEAKDSLQAQLTHLESDLRMVTAVVAPQLLDHISPVITAALDSSGSQLAAKLQQPIQAIQMLRDNGAKPPVENVRPVSHAALSLVQKHGESPEAWKFAAELVSYQTDAVRPALPECDIAHTNPGTFQFANPAAGGFIGYVFFGCALDLSKLPARSGAGFPTMVTSGIVIYHGGEIQPGNGPFVFMDCRFDISVQQVPSRQVQSLLEAALSDPSNVRTGGSKS